MLLLLSPRAVRWGGARGDEGPDPEGIREARPARLLPRLCLPLGLRLTHTYTAASDQSPRQDVFAASPKQTGVSTQLRETLGGHGHESPAAFKVLVIDQPPVGLMLSGAGRRGEETPAREHEAEPGLPRWYPRRSRPLSFPGKDFLQPTSPGNEPRKVIINTPPG